jgi:hypothetical protein
MDHRLQSETDVQQHLGVPVAGSISYAKSAALHKALDAQTVQQRLNGAPNKTLEKGPLTKLLTSPHDTIPS